MESGPNTTVSSEGSLVEKLNLVKGADLTIVKRALDDAHASDIGVGEVLQGTLRDRVKIGSTVAFNEGGNTSSVKNIFEESGHHYLQTATSKYEIIKQDFKGLTLRNEYGEIKMPFDAMSADLGSEVIDRLFGNEKQKLSLHINQKVLSQHLLEVNGAHLFRAMHGRFFVLAKET